MGKKLSISIEIAIEKCIGCGRCVALCAKQVLKMKSFDNHKMKAVCVWSAKCNGCGICEIVCPRKSIELEVMEIATPLALT